MYGPVIEELQRALEAYPELADPIHRNSVINTYWEAQELFPVVHYQKMVLWENMPAYIELKRDFVAAWCLNPTRANESQYRLRQDVLSWCNEKEQRLKERARSRWWSIRGGLLGVRRTMFMHSTKLSGSAGH